MTRKTPAERLAAINQKIEAEKARERQDLDRVRDEAKQRRARLLKQRNLAEARHREEERRRDTRRKIILGGGLIAHVRLGSPMADDLYKVLVAGVSDRDRPLFEDWSPAGDRGARQT